eukprot:2108564-Amphidinium_carterae.1
MDRKRLESTRLLQTDKFGHRRAFGRSAYNVERCTAGVVFRIQLAWGLSDLAACKPSEDCASMMPLDGALDREQALSRCDIDAQQAVRSGPALRRETLHSGLGHSGQT